MQGFISFIQANSRLLAFGLVLAFFSSFGQTFLISLYIPQIESVFGFTNTGLSSLYAGATMASAFALPWIGRLVDTIHLTRFTLGILLGCTLACLILSLAFHPALVLLGFFGLRLFGQGLLSHTSVSTMARSFVQNRGKAISIASLGHPGGEALLPLLVTVGITAIGWRSTLQVSALVLMILVVPLTYYLLSAQSKEVLMPRLMTSTADRKHLNPLRVARDYQFWIIAPALFKLGFFSTAIFFYQIKLGNSRGWDPTWVAGSLSVYALVSALSMMGSGSLVDRLTARRLFPYILIPFLLGISILAVAQHPIGYPVALVFIAMSNGAGSTIMNALFAEVFGAEKIGTVRSLFAMVMVFSTSMGPLCFGLLLDGGWSYSSMFFLSGFILLLVSGWSFTLRRAP